MKTLFLLPRKFKKIGLIIFCSTALFSLIAYLLDGIELLKNVPVFAIVNNNLSTEQNGMFRLIYDDLHFEIISILLIISFLFIAFSKQKIEDEFISKIRIESLVWATYVHFLILIFLILTVYGFPFLDVMLVNMFSILILFIIRFNYVLYKSKAPFQYDK